LPLGLPLDKAIRALFQIGVKAFTLMVKCHACKNPSFLTAPGQPITRTRLLTTTLLPSFTVTVTETSTLLTSPIYQSVNNAPVLNSSTEGAAAGKYKEGLSVGQLVVGVFILIGVGKVVEHLGKKAWKAIGMFARTLAPFPLLLCIDNRHQIMEAEWR
jgi:hypothetical protein